MADAAADTARLPALRRLAYVLCGDADRADDIVQQTITTLFVRWPKIRAVTHLDQLTNLPETLSDDGRVIGGQADDRAGVIHAVVWTCT